MPGIPVKKAKTLKKKSAAQKTAKPAAAKSTAAAHSGKIIVLDFGSQYTQLIARRLRELRYYCEIHPFHIGLDAIKKLNPAGIILSGGPASVYEKGAPHVDKGVLELGVPVLGICYGLHLICYLTGGKVEGSSEREFGRATLKARKASPLLTGIKSGQVWMSHGDKIVKLPQRFSVIGTSENSPMAAFADEKARIYGLQFHPEVHHSTQGKVILKNFAAAICGVKPNWTMSRFVDEKVTEIKKLVGKGELLGILFGPDERVDPALRRALHADAEHVRVDVGDSDAGARPLHAEGDVAGAARHVEDRLALARFDAAHEAILPQAMHTARHRIVHHVILARDAAEHFADHRGLLARGDLLIAEADGFRSGHAIALSCGEKQSLTGL